jgi:hypothetical protein
MLFDSNQNCKMSAVPHENLLTYFRAFAPGHKDRRGTDRHEEGIERSF